jgi:hypothetical protein
MALRPASRQADSCVARGALSAIAPRGHGVDACRLRHMLDANVVALSHPSVARDLCGGFMDVEWVVSACILAFAL